jgi:predicted DNA-binding WGR domain protein
MDELLTDLAHQSPEIQLAAVDNSRNIRRGYTISRSRDLFGWHVVTWYWGRLGNEPRCRARAFPEETAAVAFARQLLKRRASAPKRIGLAYRPLPSHR